MPSSLKSMSNLENFGFNLLPLPPYSSDLAPGDFWYFADLEKILKGKRFGSKEKSNRSN